MIASVRMDDSRQNHPEVMPPEKIKIQTRKYHVNSIVFGIIDKGGNLIDEMVKLNE